MIGTGQHQDEPHHKMRLLHALVRPRKCCPCAKASGGWVLGVRSEEKEPLLHDECGDGRMPDLREICQMYRFLR